MKNGVDPTGVYGDEIFCLKKLDLGILTKGGEILNSSPNIKI